MEWEYIYKINPAYPDVPEETNLIYTPWVSTDNARFCMQFDHTSSYQLEDLQRWLPERPLYTKELVKFFFDREVKNISHFSKYSWAPQNIDIDYRNQAITFDWNGINCNHIVYGGKRLEDYCPDWKEQLLAILRNIVSAGYYKTSLYPHCFFISNGVLRTIDFYGVQSRMDPYVPLVKIQGMIGTSSNERFDEAITGNCLDVGILFRRALERYVVWPDDYLKEVYKKLYV